MSKIRDFTTAYYQKNIVGPVSQVAGVPTGAIIQTGSTSSGKYTKFADGTLIQQIYYTANQNMVSTGSVLISPQITITLPHDTLYGAGSSALSGSGGDSAAHGWVTGYLANTSQINVVYFSTGAAGTRLLTLYFTLVGRWY